MSDRVTIDLLDLWYWVSEECSLWLGFSPWARALPDSVWIGPDGHYVVPLHVPAARDFITRALWRGLEGCPWHEAVAPSWQDRGEGWWALTDTDGQIVWEFRASAGESELEALRSACLYVMKDPDLPFSTRIEGATLKYCHWAEDGEVVEIDPSAVP